MRCVDVNVLVNAFRDDAVRHGEHRAWLIDAAADDEVLGLPSASLDGFLRVVTHPRIFARPTPIDEAVAFADALLGGARVVEVRPGEQHRGILHDLVTELGLRGNDIPDASLAALAIERGASFWSSDRGFARFPELRWRHPLDAAGDP